MAAQWALVLALGLVCVTALAAALQARRAARLAAQLAALEAPASQPRLISENGPDASWVFHVEQFRLIDVNDNFALLAGRSREQLIGATPLDVSAPLQGTTPTDEYARAIVARALTGERVVTPWTLRGPDGEDIPCELRAIHVAAPDRTLIVGSLLDIRARVRAEAELRYRMQLEALIMRLSTRMISVTPAVSDVAIHQALGEIGQFAQVDRSYVFRFDAAGARVSCTHEWCAPDIEPEIQRLQNLRVEDFPWVEQRLKRGEVVHVPRVADVPPEAAPERAEWQAEGIQSLLLVPIRFGEAVTGYVGFDAVRSEKTWPDDHIALLKIFGEMVSSLVERSRTETLLRQQRDSLEQANRELERSNVELKHFAYAASHDLQEPLRAISGFSSLLARQYGGRLDATADEYIGYITSSASRLHAMIVDLLEYSRIDARARPFEPCDLERVLGLALANLRASISELGAEITHDPLPRVLGDGSQLMQLFQNLVGNALKFHDAHAPRVHIGATLDGEGWTLRVVDNGIGVPAASAARLFQLFQRLHDRDRYPGSGIGLAVCKRIVERHRGRIWAEANPGGGSAFCFTLPALPAQAAA